MSTLRANALELLDALTDLYKLVSEVEISIPDERYAAVTNAAAAIAKAEGQS